MAKRFLTHIDLTKNQLLNAAFEKLGSDPLSGNFEGRIYYNTASALLKVFDGVEWVAVGAITDVVGTPNEVDVSVVNGVATISLPTTINANTTGNAATATTLATARAISLGGDLSGSASFNGGSDITINATIKPDSVTLGTDTTGNYVATVGGTDGVSVTGTGEGASVTIANTDKGSSQNIFKNISDGTNIAVADNNNDTFTISAGTGIGVSVNATTDTATISNTGVVSIAGTTNEIDVSASAGSVTISLPSTINADTTGNAATATKLQTARTIALAGDVAGSVLFDGSASVSINTTIQPDSVSLGTDTTGNYVAGVTGSGAGISVTGNGEGASVVVSNTGVTSIAGTASEIEVSASAGAVTVGLPNNVIITNDLTVGGNAVVTGNLTVNGTTTTINTENLNVEDNIITLNSGLSASVAPTLNAGIEVNRGSASAVQLRWNETLDVWQATTDGTTYKKILLSGDATSADISDFNEAAQDAVGGMVANTATINLSYNDGTPSLTANAVLKATDSYLSASSGLAVDLAALETKLVVDSFTRKVSANVGNSSGTSFAITHNLGTRDVVVNVYDNATYDTVECDVVRTDTNNVTVSFSVAPGTNAYRVVIIG